MLLLKLLFQEFVLELKMCVFASLRQLAKKW